MDIVPITSRTSVGSPARCTMRFSRSDFCIAVLHGFNPNVFYELAVAHSAGIPVILMCEKGIDPPFDLKDERASHYDLSPRAIYSGENARALVAMIEGVRRLQGKREVPFGNNLIPLNATGTGLPYSLTSETNATAEYWLDLGRPRAQAALSCRHRLHRLAGYPRDAGSHRDGGEFRLSGSRDDDRRRQSGARLHAQPRHHHDQRRRRVPTPCRRAVVVQQGARGRPERGGQGAPDRHAVSADHRRGRPDAGFALSLQRQYRVQPAPGNHRKLARLCGLPARVRGAVDRERAGCPARAAPAGGVTARAPSRRPLAGSFMDRAMPRAARLLRRGDRGQSGADADQSLGVKGAGEAGTVGSLSAGVNAIVDALSVLGIRHIDTPCTPYRGWQAIANVGAERREAGRSLDLLIWRARSVGFQGWNLSSGGGNRAWADAARLGRWQISMQD